VSTRIARKRFRNSGGRRQEAVSRRQSEVSCRLLPAVCLLALHDPSTTDDFVATIKHGRLTGGDRSLRLIKLDPRARIRQRSYSRGRGGMAIANAHFRAHRLARIIQSDPVDAGRREFVAQQLFLMSGDDPVLHRIDADDIQGLRFGDAECNDERRHACQSPHRFG